MLEEEPHDDHEDHEGDGGGKVVFYAGVGGEEGDVHAEEAGYEGEGEEYKCYPGEAPHGGAELEGVARVADFDGFVHLHGEVSLWVL